MDRALTIAARAMPCPGCGYDLRATEVGAEGVRCPECGKVTPLAGAKGLTASRVPWVQRRWRGQGKCFAATAWWVVFQPWKLAREKEVPARLRDARRFQLLCLFFGMEAGCGFFLGVMFAIGHEVRLPPDWPAWRPAVAPLDPWCTMVLLPLGAFVATWVCAALYRRIVVLGGGAGCHGEPRYESKRLLALSYYTAALWVVYITLGGLAGVLALTWEDRVSRWPHSDATLLAVGTLGAGAAAAVVYLWSSLGLVLRTGRWRWVRAGLMAVYMVVSPALWITVAVAVNWAVGYVVLGVISMVR